MKKISRIIVLFFVMSTYVKAENTLDKELADKCFSVFSVIKENDVKDYLSMHIQVPNNEKEKGYLVRRLNNRHKWFVAKHKGWKSLDFKYIEYENPEQTEVEQYLTDKIAFSYFRLVMNDEKETKVATQCKFAKVKDKWFLMKLP